jgi:hypothetical protein
MDRRGDAAAVERHDRQQVEEVDEEAGEAEGDEELRVLLLAHEPDGGGADRAHDRASDRDLRLPPGVERILL